MPWLALCWVVAELAIVLVVWFRIAKPNGVTGRVVWWLLLGSAFLVAPVRLLQGFLLESLEMNPAVGAQGAWGALLASMGLLAPIEQTALVLVVWPVHRSSHLLRMSAAVSAGILVAIGFSMFDGGWMLLTGNHWSMLVRALVRGLHTAGACIIWAAAASYDQNERKHWFALAWLVAVLVQGFGNHVALGRGPGFAVLSLPLLLVLLTAAVSVLRNGSARSTATEPEDYDDVVEEPRVGGVLSMAKRLSRISILPERPTIHQIRVAWQHQHRPALLHWIAAGALICLGALFVAIATSVVVSRWLAVDLSRIDDNEFSATGPLLFLGTFVLAAFPIGGYLVAAASAADSVFEPGMAALVAIMIVIALLSVAAPVSVIFALAVAPLAFGLACVGAWFGLRRERQ
jgi:hypothetical protein